MLVKYVFRTQLILNHNYVGTTVKGFEKGCLDVPIMMPGYHTENLIVTGLTEESIVLSFYSF